MKMVEKKVELRISVHCVQVSTHCIAVVSGSLPVQCLHHKHEASIKGGHIEKCIWAGLIKDRKVLFLKLDFLENTLESVRSNLRLGDVH